MPLKALSAKAVADFFRGLMEHRKLLVVTVGVLIAVILGITWYINRPTVTESLPFPEQRLVVGCTDNFPPFDLRDKNGNHIGYARDISTEVARELDCAIEYRTSPHWGEVVEWLKNGEVDLIHLIAYSAERDEYFDFTIPHTLVPEVIFVHSERLDIRGLDDLEGKQIGVVQRHITHEKLLKYDALNIVVFETPQEGVEALLDGKVDAFACPEYVFAYLVQQMGRENEIKIVGEPLGHLRYCMAIREGDHVLLPYLDQAIERIEASGKRDEIAQCWFGREAFLGLTQEELLSTTRWVMFGVLAVTLGGSAYIYVRYKLRKAESVLRHNLIFQHMDDSAILTSLDGKITDWNPGAERMFGHSREEVLGRRLDFLFAPENSTELLQTIIREVQDNGIWSGEIRAVRKDGSEVVCSARMTALRSEKGDITAYVSIIRDITERKRAEQAVQNAREYAESIVGTVHEPLLVLDADLRVISANRSFCQTFKVSLEETQGQFIYDMGNRQWDIPRLRELLEQILPKNTTFEDFEMEHDFATIGRRIMLLNARRIYREANKTQMVLLAIEDITERKQAEEALKKSEEHLRNVLDGLGPYMLVGLMTPDGTLIEANRPALEIAGLKPEDVLGKPYEETYWWSYSEPVKQQLRDAIRRATRGEPCRYDVAVRVGENRFITIDFCLHPLVDETGRIIYLVPSAVDITERKRAEKALRKAHDELEAKVAERTEELAQANIQLKEMDRLKSEFLATMSHELRTPLNSIIGFTGIILQGIPGDLNKEQRKQLSMVNNSAKHLLGLINDILDISRIESGKMELSAEKFKIQDVVSEVAQSLSPMISQKSLRLITEIPDETPEIYSDRKKVLQILLNLVNNAVKFTEAGEIRIDCKFDNDNLEVSVSDTGVGIKKKDMKLLFEAFRQIDGTARRRYQGAGLGLYLCQKLVTLLGGNIWAESEYGRGSKFTFTIPLRYEERET